MGGIVSNTSQSGATTQQALYISRITDEKKVSLAIERRKEITTIRKWDYMTLKNNPEQALVYYLAALERLPEDIVVRRKIAHIYYLMRDWRNAYDYYVKIPITELKENEQKELFHSLFFDDMRWDRLSEVSRYTIDPMSREYYQTIDVCYSGIHNCIVTLEWYSGSNTKLGDLREIIKKSAQISPDFQYRNFLVAAEFYKQSMYRITDILTAEILSKRPNYIEVWKLRGFALYELWKYSQARDVLLPYIEQNPKDVESLVRLADIYSSLGNYATSSLYLNNIIAAGWYAHKTAIERHLAYNYSALGDNASMLKVLSYLIQESDVTEDDFAVAVSLALHQWENTRAFVWSHTSVEKFKNSPVLVPLYLAALRMNGRSTEIPTYVTTLTDELKKNPLVQLENALSLFDEGKYDQALPIFIAIRDQNPSADWAIEANDSIHAIEKINSQNSQSGFIQS